MADAEDEKIKWMYDGPKSLVNREDYLTGKKIDRNFELYSDVVVKDKDEDRTNSLARSSISKVSKMGSSSGKKAGGLNIHVVRTEDPLVALKMKEEERKRQLLENPLIKMRMQKLLKLEFEKAVQESDEKTKKKDKKKKKSKSRSSSTSSTDSKQRKHTKRRRRHDSDSEEDGRALKKRHDSNSDVSVRRQDSMSSSRSHGHSKEHDRNYSRNRSISGEKRRRRRHDSSLSEEDPPSTSSTKHNEKNVKVETEKRPKLTKEEMEARRREMMDNVKWRNEAREENLARSKEKLKEELEANTGQVPGFIRPMLNSAAESLTVEKRLQVSRGNLQRSHDYMDKSFARK